MTNKNQLTPEQVQETAQAFKDTYPFVEDPWIYQRYRNPVTPDKPDLYALRYHSVDKQHTILARIKSAIQWISKKDSGIIDGLHADSSSFKKFMTRLDMARYVLFSKTDNCMPDGHVNDSIITIWEEAGEYISQLPPSVGTLIADFMIQYPEHDLSQQLAIVMNKKQAAMWDNVELYTPKLDNLMQEQLPFTKEENK